MTYKVSSGTLSLYVLLIPAPIIRIAADRVIQNWQSFFVSVPIQYVDKRMLAGGAASGQLIGGHGQQ